MQSAQSKKNALAYLQAHFAGDVQAARSLCAPNFESIIHAPVELFPHLGQKKGLSWVEESIRMQIERYSERRLNVVSALGDGDEAGICGSIRLTKRTDDRVIEFMSVHLFKFREGLIERHRELFDSFSLVEQLVGEDLSDEFSVRLKRTMAKPQS